MIGYWMLLDRFQLYQFGDPISGSKKETLVLHGLFTGSAEPYPYFDRYWLLWYCMSRFFFWERIRRRTSLRASSLMAGTCCAWAMPTMWKHWHELSWLSGNCGRTSRTSRTIRTTVGCEVNQTIWSTVWSRLSYHSLPETLKFVGCFIPRVS